VSLWLPATDQPVSAASAPQVAHTVGSARILLIDDEPLLRRAIAELLEDAGYGVAVAASGDEALEHLAKDRAIDLVLLDRSMPGARVEHSLPRIRELAPGAKVALFTGQEVEAPLRARVDAVIAKPIGADALFEAIGELLARATR
jgi:CheY-like chemotaxis protein